MYRHVEAMAGYDAEGVARDFPDLYAGNATARAVIDTGRKAGWGRDAILVALVQELAKLGDAYRFMAEELLLNSPPAPIVIAVTEKGASDGEA